MKIYTKSGDNLKTSLIGGSRISKDDIRIDTYGSIDELNSFIGLLLTEIKDEEIRSFLSFVQRKLFSVGAYFATDFSDNKKRIECQIWGNDIALIEQEIDKIDELLPALDKFVLPGGIKSAALSHVCRTICRRAERKAAHLYLLGDLPDQNPFVFLNRLSDYFFVLARKENFQNNTNELFW